MDDLYISDIEELALDNNAYRRVVWTTKRSQLVLMHVTDGIALEVHNDVDQHVHIVAGRGEVRIEGRDYPLTASSVVTIRAGQQHEFVAFSFLRLYTIYTPPVHPDGLVQWKNPDKEMNLRF